MLIKNAKVLVGRSFIDADILFDNKIIAVGKMDGEADLDAEGGYVCPGFVDIHTHGAVGEDFFNGHTEGMQPQLPRQMPLDVKILEESLQGHVQTLWC